MKYTSLIEKRKKNKNIFGQIQQFMIKTLSKLGVEISEHNKGHL